MTLPLCITLLECMCSSAEHSCTKYFQMVRSGIRRFCFLKCLIILERSPASANSRTMFSSLSSMKEARYLITFGWFSCYKYFINIRFSFLISIILPATTGFPSYSQDELCCPSFQNTYTFLVKTDCKISRNSKISLMKKDCPILSSGEGGHGF